jgi:hypothetical protein
MEVALIGAVTVLAVLVFFDSMITRIGRRH